MCFHEIAKKVQLTLSFFLTVAIDGLQVNDCSSSPFEHCSSKDIYTHTLVCEAKDYWPSVTLKWLQISENGSSRVSATNIQTTFNATSSLYSSKSTLKYFPDTFSLQYLTCVATGSAAYKVSNNSITIVGNIPLKEMKPNESNVMKGTDLKIPCPINKLPFGKLQVKLPKTNYKVIKIIQSCMDDNTCAESERREIVIENVNYGDEGLYQCISSDGKTAAQQDTNVIITGKYWSRKYNCFPNSPVSY